MGTGETDIGLIKLAKNTRLIIRVYTRPGVCDRKSKLLTLISFDETCRNSDAALVGKFHCVTNQV